MTYNWTFRNPDYGSYSYDVSYKNYRIVKQGIQFYLKVDNGYEMIMSKTKDLTVGDITASVSYKLFGDADYINIIHTVKNNGTKSHKISMRVEAKIEIVDLNEGFSGDYYCNQINIDGYKGVEFQGDDNHNVRFILKNSPMITDVDTYSYYLCPDYGAWNNCTDWTNINAAARIYFSWKDREIKPNEIQNYSYSIGKGKYLKRKVIIQTPIEPCYDNSNKINLSLSIESLKKGETFSIFRQVFDSSFNSVTDKLEIVSNQTDDGNTFSYIDKFTLPSSPGNYIISYTTLDSNGERTTSIPIVVNKIPNIKLKQNIEKEYQYKSFIPIKVEIDDDSFVNLSILDDGEIIVSYSIACNGNKQTVEYNLLLNGKDDNSDHNISIYAFDEFNFKSNVLDFRYKIPKLMPEIQILSQFSETYTRNETYYFTASVFCKDEVNFIMLDDNQYIYFYDNVKCHGKTIEMIKSFSIPDDYEYDSSHKISIFAEDSSHDTSNYYNFSYKVLPNNPQIKYHGNSPLYIRRNMTLQVHTDIMFDMNSRYGEVYSSINEEQYSLVAKLNDITANTWGYYVFQIDISHTGNRNGNNTINLYTIDSDNLKSNIIENNFGFFRIEQTCFCNLVWKRNSFFFSLYNAVFTGKINKSF
ncbi:hypothetical protein TVAG_303830 [Trichomonas vaginalis G3]|uniref:Uncharacterized protein n=1 Tax=Trichomonas vaginalis (strain ATCC PRA-98 / G3) TaxID=412133 RepID=A2DR65_TRIV3|nr:hypothetical protein TVAGG3_0695590 [Trichomonas vaginalis G3]EAY17164.1 hypothetical protein TVAG_303830 [Trichomonas vaginalis G3]KAI5508894.1 hypothetical protein TVAGG3_0695590 [Trichomonas vaginalis G3]|eukprot:XP_001329387.1 hypothetical protein [Trichomonas vaginalis G3]